MRDSFSFKFTVPDFEEFFECEDDNEIEEADGVTIITPYNNIWRELPFPIDNAKDIEEC